MPTVSIGNNTGTDHTGTEDTKLKSSTPSTNFAGDSLEVFSWAPSDDGTSVLRFTGLSSISGPVTVSAAEIRLYQTSHLNDPLTIDAHRLLRNWVEAQATADNYSTGNAWQTQLGVGALDIDSTVLASQTVDGTTGTYFTWSGAQLAAVVENSINGVYANHGFLLKPDTFAHATDACEFAASEGSDGQRPVLVFTYTSGSTYTLSTEPGAITLSDSVPAGLRAGRRLTAAAGSVALAGTAAALSATRRLAAASGSVLVTGTPADLISTGTDVIYERYIRAELAAITLVDDLQPTSPRTTLTIALGPILPRRG